ncbi:type II secretion system F family protein [Marinagarivorans algicola]|uniref:type II secretion system F family protein n=1 Tax=Marinagarivorans algicola TaxID=1513270 RepID=UPI0006B4D340|nr:type II secretion system F family protein [Marinagarivorans algicola]
MATFKFFGRTNQGQPITGVLDAASPDAVALQLQTRGVTPVNITEVTMVASAGMQLGVLLGSQKIKSVELIMFCRQMYTITKSGIPLVRGIRGLAASIRHEHFREVLNDISDRLESGMTLSAALSKHPVVFNHLFVSMINVGESSGKLEDVFKQLAFYLERDEATRKSIKSAIRYPMFVIIALAIAMTIVNVFVVPKFAAMFEKYDAPLPLVTKILMATSSAFIHYWWVLLLIAGIIAAGIYLFLRNPKGAQIWGRFKLKLPVVGETISRALMARYARSFALMLKAGLPVNQALTLCSRAIDNPYLAEKIEGIRRGVERGDSLIRTHVATQLFSPLILQMISVGEESGQVDQLLEEVADFYEREVDYDLKTLSAKIEPILIVVMAGFVTVLALGIFLPMWDMYSVQKSG